jgi:hypothetical protein
MTHIGVNHPKNNTVHSEPIVNILHGQTMFDVSLNAYMLPASTASDTNDKAEGITHPVLGNTNAR